MCGANITRKEMKDHTNSCTSKNLCPLASFGCNTDPKEIFDLESHISENMASHLLHAVLMIRKQQDTITSLEEEISQLKTSREKTKTISTETPTHHMPIMAEVIPSTIPTTTESSTRSSSPPSSTAPIQKVNFDFPKKEPKNPLKESKGVDKYEEDQLALSTSLEIGLKLVSALPADAQASYSKLVNKPQLMIETLIMNSRFDCLDLLYDFMPGVFRDDLFFSYAKKSLNFSSVNYESQIRVGLEPIRGPIQAPSSAQDTYMLTGDSNYDNEMRAKHRFPGIEGKPNCELSLRLLSYCDELKTAYWTVQLRESFEGYVTGFVSSESNVQLVEALIKILQFGKVLFLKHPVEAHSGIIELCDSFLAQLDIMLRIVISKKSLQVQMADFGDAHKTRALRDKLIDHLLFDIARDLCLRTNSSSDPVNIAWGLHHLRQSQFNDARQMFKISLNEQQRSSSLISAGTTSSTSSSSSMASTNASSLHKRRNSSSNPSQLRAGVDTQLVLENILNILDPPPSAIPKSLNSSSSSIPAPKRSNSALLQRSESVDKRKSAHPSLLGSKGSSPSIITKGDATTRSTVDVSDQLGTSNQSTSILTSKPSLMGEKEEQKIFGERKISQSIEECLYYLDTYGSNATMLKFCMKHGLLEKAARFSFEYQIEMETFVEKLIIPCSDKSLLSELKQAFERADPDLSRSKPYLIATCKYLNEQKAFKTLVSFQVFMRDFVRAALTCIRVFMDTNDANYRVQCLDLAKSYFEEALKVGQNESSAEAEEQVQVMSNANISSYIMKIDIQREALKALAPLVTKMPQIAEMSLFGPPTQRTTITSILLVYKLHLGLRVLSDTIKREDWPTVFSNTGSFSARQLSHSQMLQLNKEVKEAGADDEWLDLMLKSQSEVYATEKKDFSLAERLAKSIVQPKVRCLALIDCGKLKSAYLEAVKLSDPLSLVAMIAARAGDDKDQSVLKLCNNFMTQHGNK